MPHWLGTEHALKCKWMHLNASRRMSMQPSALDCNKRIVKPSKWTPNVCCLTLNAFWIFDKLHFILGGLHFRMFAFQLLMAHNRGHNTTFFVFFFPSSNNVVVNIQIINTCNNPRFLRWCNMFHKAETAVSFSHETTLVLRRVSPFFSLSLIFDTPFCLITLYIICPCCKAKHPIPPQNLYPPHL